MSKISRSLKSLRAQQRYREAHRTDALTRLSEDLLKIAKLNPQLGTAYGHNTKAGIEQQEIEKLKTYQKALSEFVKSYSHIRSLIKPLSNNKPIREQALFQQGVNNLDKLCSNAKKVKGIESVIVFIESRSLFNDGLVTLQDTYGFRYRKPYIRHLEFACFEGPAMVDMVYKADHTTFSLFLTDLDYLANKYGLSAANEYGYSVIKEINDPESGLVFGKITEESSPLVDFLISGAIGAKDIIEEYGESKDKYGYIFSNGLEQTAFALARREGTRLEQIRYGYSHLKAMTLDKQGTKALNAIIQNSPADIRILIIERIKERPDGLALYSCLEKHGLDPKSYVQFLFSHCDMVLPPRAKEVIAQKDIVLPEQISAMFFLSELLKKGIPYLNIAARLANDTSWYQDSGVYTFLSSAPQNLHDTYITYLRMEEANKRKVLQRLVESDWSGNRLDSAISSMKRVDDALLEDLVDDPSISNVVKTIKQYADRPQTQSGKKATITSKTVVLDKKEILLNLLYRRYGFNIQTEIQSAYDALEKHGLETMLLSVARTQSKEVMDRFTIHAISFVRPDQINPNYAFILGNSELASMYIQRIQDNKFDDDEFSKLLGEGHSNPYSVFKRYFTPESAETLYGTWWIEKEVEKVPAKRICIFGGNYKLKRRSRIISEIVSKFGMEAEIYDFHQIHENGLKMYTPNEDDAVIIVRSAIGSIPCNQLKASCNSWGIPFFQTGEYGTNTIMNLIKERITSSQVM